MKTASKNKIFHLLALANVRRISHKILKEFRFTDSLLVSLDLIILSVKREEKMNELFVTAPQPTLKRVADVDGPDFYPTPDWATFALIDNENFVGDIWECACGDGAMSSVLEKTGQRVESSDLFDRGFGEVGVDFRNTNRKARNIITNPPFNAAEEFVHSALGAAEGKFALLLRLAFLEGAKRQETIFRSSAPSRVWVFSERITFYPKGAQRKGSGTTAYAWFVWDKDHVGNTELKWLPTGYKKMNIT